MPDASLPGATVGDELRRIIAERRRRHRRLRLFSLTGIASALVAATAFWNPPTLLVWNASASAPIGLYRVAPGAPPRRGDMAAAWVPQRARSLAASRQYLPANVPLVKRVAAVGGDRICAEGKRIFINGQVAATRRVRDLSGRAMPWWSGCIRLGRADLFLLSPAGPLAFDGRYFGVTRARDVLGEAQLLWPR